MEIIDIHTHAFPDELAARAVPHLEEEGNVKAKHDGRLVSLLRSMDRAGISRSVVASIATKPSQFDSILDWSTLIASDRIIPFASVHPDDPNAPAGLNRIKVAGLKGVKLHPYYQQFAVDDRRMDRIYERIRDLDLVLLLHAGFDIAFERNRVADPQRIVNVLDRFPRLKLVAAHFGAWEDWDEVERLMLGREIYIDTSYSVAQMGAERSRRFLLGHPPECVLFGTDSPWGNQEADVREILSMDLGGALTEAILSGNSTRLLGL